ncbi:MAG: LysR family transcriptional regulator ArgP [Planctomycetota bacterium]
MKSSSCFVWCISIANVEIDLSQLRALAAVVDEGSFDAAATVLHVTPSAVSQRIKALERAAGRVLVRRAKPTAVTDAGHSYLRLARQVDVLVHAAGQEASPDDLRPAVIPLAINADSLATWVLPALAGFGGDVCFDIRREDQDDTAHLLRTGAVMAAITTDAEPVQGCRSTRLGTMRYRPMASPQFFRTWFATGIDAAALSRAPVVVFDRRDDLQDRYLRQRIRRRLDPPRHHIPASSDFAEAVRLGLGWATLPDQQSAALEEAGQLVDIDPGRHVDVTLYWQQWALRTPVLEAVAAAVGKAAAEHLT